MERGGGVCADDVERGGYGVGHGLDIGCVGVVVVVDNVDKMPVHDVQKEINQTSNQNTTAALANMTITK